MRFLVAAKPRKAQACVEHGPQKIESNPGSLSLGLPMPVSAPGCVEGATVMPKIRCCSAD